MSTWLTAILTRLGASLARDLLRAAGRRVKNAFQTAEEKAALAHCLEAALGALVEQGLTGDPETARAHVQDVLEKFAAEEAVQDELLDLLDAFVSSGATPLDPKPLRKAFADLYDPGTLSDFDTERGFAAFVVAFGEQTKKEPALQETIRTHRVDELVRGQRELLEVSRAGVEVQRESRDELRSIREELTGDSSAEGLRRGYLSHLFRKAGELALSGVDPAIPRKSDTRLKLYAVYTALLTRAPESDMESVGEEKRHRLPRAATRSALDRANQFPHLVLLGDPGSGKSTFVNYLALCLAGEALGRPEANLALLTRPLPEEPERPGRDSKPPEPQSWDHGPHLPVRVILRDFAASEYFPKRDQDASADALWQFIEQELTKASLAEFAPIFKEILRKDGGLILLDGLDEVPEASERRRRLKKVVEDFVAVYDECRFLVTSRIYAYENQEWQLDGFHEEVLAPFHRGQIVAFIDRWYAHAAALGRYSEADATGRAVLLKNRVLGSSRLRELAERPLLLTLMASLHAWRGGDLPEKREELYARAVDLVLDWWEQQRVVYKKGGEPRIQQPSLTEWLKVEPQAMRAFLDELAFKVHAAQPENKGTADIPEAELIKGLLALSPDRSLRPGKLIEYLEQRAGLLEARGVETYTFPHRSFQEYLAACHLTRGDLYPNRMAKLARSDPDRWREVALLAGAKAARGTAMPAWSLVDALCPVAPKEGTKEIEKDEDGWGALLAGQVAVENGLKAAEKQGPQDVAKLQRVKKWLLLLLRSGFPVTERAEAGRALGELGDTRREVLTCDAMELCWVPAGPFVLGSREDDEAAYKDETPRQDYDLEGGYWIARHPVSQAQFRAFVAAGGYDDEGLWPEAKAAGVWAPEGVKGWGDEEPRTAPAEQGHPFDLPNHPVVGVTWYEALAFVRWLTHKWRAADWLPEGWQVDLPSEVEWEKAARGGYELPLSVPPRKASSGLEPPAQPGRRPNPLVERRFPWGDEPPDGRLLNFADANLGTTTALGCFPAGASPYGCEDLSGNVWEWTRSLWADYPYAKAGAKRLQREAVASESPRVLRGGAFHDGLRRVRVAVRLWGSPDSRRWGRGFRFVVRPFFSDL